MVAYKNDKPDKYGFTQKETDIWELVYTGKKLEDGGFEITKEDREYYEYAKEQYEICSPGKPKGWRFEHFVNDVDCP